MKETLPGGLSPHSRAPKSATAWLNGLRGCASVIVALNHYLYGEFAAPWLGFLSGPENRWAHQLPFVRTVWCGHAMPPLFFVISGYCACWSALRLRDAGHLDKMLASLSSSALRRGMRLYLPVFFMAALSQLVFFCGLYHWRWTEVTLEPWRSPWSHFKYLVSYLVDMTMVVYPTDNPGLNAQYWVIPVEYQGSLVAYLCVLATARVKPAARPLVLSAIVAYLLWWGTYTTYTFVAGVLLAELTRLRESGGGEHLPAVFAWTSRKNVNRAVFVLGFYLVGTPNNYAETPGFRWLARLEPPGWGEVAQHNWRAIAAILFVYGMSNSTTLQSVPNSRLPQYLSTISFEIYLSHMMLYRMFRNPLVDFFASFFPPASPAAFWCGFVASGVVMATCVHWFAENLKVVNGKLQSVSKWIEAKLQDTM